MNRARVIVKEISILKKGEVHFFQIRLPKNTIRIRGVEYDAFMLSQLAAATPAEPAGPTVPSGGISGGVSHQPVRTTFLKWTPTTNPTLGKLKLQNLDAHNLFYETWVPFMLYGGGMPDLSYGLFPKSPYTLNTNGKPKHVDLSCNNQVINGMFEDAIGSKQNADLNYRLKVFIWIETSENANGVIYDFQESESEIKQQSKN